jgi:hypothetical protein
MIIISEKQQPLVEMAYLPKDKAPKVLSDRTARLVIDKWYYDRSEEINELGKVAFRFSLGIDSIRGKDIVLDFDYGFIQRTYKYAKGNAKASGAPNNRKWNFCALHLISNVPGAEGQWGRNNFEDKYLEIILTYENDMYKLGGINAQAVSKLVKDFKLTKRYGDILQLCNELL